jgi:D-alanine-D-alanine ligase
MFGGRSVEHEISVITALQMMRAIDVVEYEPIPVYISLAGKWYCGEPLMDQSFYRKVPAALDTLDEVILLPIPGGQGLRILRKSEDTKSVYGNEEGIIPVDIYFPIFHGSYGEDGCIQGLFELAEVPYACSGVLASAVSMNKQFCKDIVARNGVSVLPSLVISKEVAQKDMGRGLVEMREKILTSAGFEKFPLFVKPCTLGSSVGIGRATSVPELDAALLQAFRYDSQVMVEPCLDNKLEINIAVLDGVEPIASVTEIPIPAAGKELTYEDKYLRGGGKKSGGEAQGMAALTRVIDPPELSGDIKKLVKQQAIAAFMALGCSGAARLDFMLDLNTEKLYFNEINPIPGALSFYLWANSQPQILLTELVARMIQRGQRAFQEKILLTRDFGFRALAKSS